MRPAEILAICTMSLATLGSADLVQAAGMDGNGLLSNCQRALRAFGEGDTSARSLEAGICLGYAAGYRDALDYQKLYTPIEICIPDAATNGQIMRVLVKFLEENPEQLHQNAGALAFAALKIAYACTDQ